MIRGTTPPIEINLPNDASNYKEIVCTFKQGGKIVIEKKLSDMTVEGQKLSFRLTQEETLGLSASEYVVIQIRAVTTDDRALATWMSMTSVQDVLNEKVLPEVDPDD